jgi:peptidyl-prolyl cis-trans isomerase B (cyclophilin B)
VELERMEEARVSASKREREQARKRYEKWEARRQVAAQRHQRNVALGWSWGIILTVAVIVVATQLPKTLAENAPADAVEETAAADTVDETDSLDPEVPTDTASIDATVEPTDPSAEEGASAPDPSLAEGRAWTGSIETNEGAIAVELDGVAAPQAVANFVSLGGEGFFDGTDCHRLTTSGIYVLQCGNPLGLEGDGGPGYSFGPIENAPADDVYPAGTLAMARISADGSSMGSQFFIVYEDSTILSDAAGGYTVFGRVTEGLDVVTRIAEAGVADGGSDGAPATPVTIERVQLQ